MLFQGFKGLLVVRNHIRPENASLSGAWLLKLTGLLASIFPYLAKFKKKLKTAFFRDIVIIFSPFLFIYQRWLMWLVQGEIKKKKNSRCNDHSMSLKITLGKNITIHGIH